MLFYRPLVLCALALAAGIALSPSAIAVHIGAPMFFCVAIVSALFVVRARRHQTAMLVCASCAMLCAGMAAGASIHPRASYPAELCDRGALIEGSVDGSPGRAAGRERIAVQVERVWIDGAQRLARAGLLLGVREGSTELRPGDRVRFACTPRAPRGAGSPGAPDYARILDRRGAALVCSVATPDDVVLISREGRASPAGLIGRARAAVNARLALDVVGTNGAILRALVTGDAGDLPQKTRDAFALSGTAHILSISGLHTSLVAHLFYLLALALFLVVPSLPLRVNAPRAAAVAAVAFVWCYAAFAGAPPATVRAAIMTTAFFAAVVIGRDPDLPSSIALAAIAILLYNPADLFEVGFQLSFASVIAIAALCPRLVPESADDPLAPYRGGRPRAWLLSFLAMTAAATVGTAPIVAYYFNQISLISPLANLVAVPLTTYLIVPGGLVAAALYGVWPAAGSLVAQLCGRLCGALEVAASGSASLPGSHAFLSTPTILEMVLFWGAMALLIYGWRRGWAMATAATLVVALAGAWALDLRSHRHPGEFEVTFVDVGEGDCVFAALPDGTTLLVDGGGAADLRFDPGRSIVAPYLYHRRITRLDAVILTHAHADHMNGLHAIAARFGPRRFITTAAVLDDPAAKPLVETMKRIGARVETVDAATPPLAIGGATLEFYNPPPGGRDAGNDGSLVMRLSAKGLSFLLTGDIQDAGEHAVLATGRPIAATVLKVAHQGSKTSSHDDFLDAVSPSFAVVMAGVHNPFGFPHDEVLARMEAHRIRLLRTDRHGSVTFVTGGVTPPAPSCFLNGCR